MQEMYTKTLDVTRLRPKLEKKEMNELVQNIPLK